MWSIFWQQVEDLCFPDCSGWYKELDLSLIHIFIFTESVFSKKEIENIKKNDGNTEFLNYFYKTFEEKYSPLKQDNNNNLIIGVAENIDQINTVIENTKKPIKQAFEVESNINDGRYLNNSKLNIAIEDTIKELNETGEYTGSDIVADSMEFFESIGIKWKDLETVEKISHTRCV